MKNKFIFKTALVFICTCLAIKSFSQCSVTSTDTAGSGGLVNFYCTFNGGHGTITYLWDFGDGGNANTANATHTFAYNYNYTVCLTVYDTGSCYDTICRVVQVTNALQSATCAGNAAFTASANGSSMNFTNSAGNWQIIHFGDGSGSSYTGSTSISHQYQLNGTYTVIAIASSYFGTLLLPCDTSVQTISVNNVACRAAFTVNSDTADYRLYLNDNSFGAANRKWYINDTLVASNVTSYTSPSMPPGTYHICLAITGPGGCQDSTCQDVNLNYSLPCPNATFRYGAVNGAACDTYWFIVDTTGTGINSINWYLNGNWVSSQAVDTITLDFSSSNVSAQSVTVFVKGPGCQSGYLFPFSNPASFYVSSDTSNFNHTWYAYPQTVTNLKSQLWDFGDGTSSTSAYPSHTYSTAGFYNVCHYDTLTNNCAYKYCIDQYLFRATQGSGISYFVVVPPLGIQEQKNVASLKAYPNPASSIITFDFENKPETDMLLKVYNSTGIVVNTAAVEKGTTKYILNIKDFADGIYFYELSGIGGSSVHGKIIITK